MEAIDLPGHGFGDKLEQYSFQGFVDCLHQHMQQAQRYDIVAGISFGSTILAALLHLLDAKLCPSRAILGDPVLDMDCTPYPLSRRKGMTQNADPFPGEDDLARLPGWSRQDAMLKRWNLTRAVPEAVYALFQVSEYLFTCISLYFGPDKYQGGRRRHMLSRTAE